MKTIALILITIFFGINLHSQNQSIRANQIELNIEYEDEVTLITWQTKREINSSCFIIEKKVAGQAYEIIRIVKAKGYSTVSQEYVLEDVEANLSNTIYKVSLVKMGGEICSESTSSLLSIAQLESDTID